MACYDVTWNSLVVSADKLRVIIHQQFVGLSRMDEDENVVGLHDCVPCSNRTSTNSLRECVQYLGSVWLVRTACVYMPVFDTKYL